MADNAIDSNPICLLKHLHCCLSFSAEASIDTTSSIRETTIRLRLESTHPALQTANWKPSGAVLEYGLALISLVDVSPCDRADNSINSDLLGLLKCPHGGFGLRPEHTINWSGIVSQSFESLLYVAHCRISRTLL